MKTVDLAAGTIVAGKFTIVSPLGRTPWASTYRALAEPNRDLALKAWSGTTLERREDEEELRRVRDAARALPEHWVLSPDAVGVDEEKALAWAASPLSPTPSLGELVELCPLTPAETASFLRSLGRVLDAAHAAGVAHLALKPTNVFVGPGPAYAAKVSDFGAYVLCRACANVAARSAGAAWEAPEQVDGRARPGPAADVFAAALLAFFAMTRGSFWASCESPASPHLAALKNEMLAARSLASERAKALGREIPVALDPVFSRALAVAPSVRYASVGDLAAAFADALGVQPESVGAVAAQAAVAPTEAPPTAGVESVPAVAAHVPPPPPPLFGAPDAMLAAPAAPAQDAHAFDLAAAAFELAQPPADASASVRIDALLRPSPIAQLVARVKRLDQKQIIALAAAGGASLLGLLTLVIVLAVRSGGDAAAKTNAAASASASASAATSVAELDPAPDTAPPPPAPASAAPAPPTSEPASAALGANESEIEIVCEPACDHVALDGHQRDPSTPIARVRPGPHAIGVAKAGYRGDWRRVTVAGGKRETVRFDLVAATAAPPVVARPAAPPPAKKPCGKFLKRCD